MRMKGVKRRLSISRYIKREMSYKAKNQKGRRKE
jgi:hypothetical protein